MKNFVTSKIAAIATFFILGILTASTLHLDRLRADSTDVNLKGQTGSPPTLKLDDPLPANLFVELNKAVNPAVVNISTTIGGRRAMPRDPLFDFFEEFMGPQGMPMIQAPPAQALGSGFIVSSDGLIITNNHVIEGANSIKIQLVENSDKFYEAKVLGHDSRTDVAMLKIDAPFKLPVVQLGSSKDVQVGEWVAAFGNPFGHGHTLSKGIISAKDRSISEINRFPFLQTDASINPGNSGGPLVNTHGQVIGVNTAIDARGPGIGFAIPIDDVKMVIGQLQKYGSVRRGHLGVALKDLTPQEAQYFGLRSLDGAMIVQIDPKGPAAEAGMHQYDIVTQFGDRKIKTSQDLSNAVADAELGSQVPIKIIRDGHSKTLNVKVEQEIGRSARRQSVEMKQYSGQKAPFNLGFKTAENTERLRHDLRLGRAPHQGPIVIEVESGSIAEQAGVEVGDIIVEVNQHPVKMPAEVDRLLKEGNNMIRLIRQNMLVIIYISTQQ